MGRTVTISRRAATRKDATKSAPAKGKTEPASKSPVRSIRTYRAALDYLASLVNYERRPPARRDTPFKLERIQKILAQLDHPEKKFRSVHIAGTKGKGSTVAMLAGMLQGTGLKVGVYTSPHIMDVRERIAIGGTQISETDFIKCVAKVAEAAQRAHVESPTFFEVLTAAAFLYYADQKVDIAVLETGLGGRLDCTNVVKPEVCGLVNISMDHMEFLGNTISAIAEEKAGIIKEGVPVVSAPQTKEVKRIFKRVAESANAPLFFSGDDYEYTYRFESSRASGPQARICISTPTSHWEHLAVPLVGEHQAVNCGVAMGILDQLKQRGYAIDDERAIAGLSRVRLPGRMEQLCTEPRVIVDGAHNASSIEALMRAIGQNIGYDSMVVIFGCCVDKDIPGMLKHILLGADKVIFTPMSSPRSASPADLAAQFSEITGGKMAQVAQSLGEAMEIAEKAVTRDDLICITGSFYLVADAKRFFSTHPHRIESIGNP